MKLRSCFYYGAIQREFASANKKTLRSVNQTYEAVGAQKLSSLYLQYESQEA